jgi:hypothetical protein
VDDTQGWPIDQDRGEKKKKKEKKSLSLLVWMLMVMRSDEMRCSGKERDQELYNQMMISRPA